jgi:hypothetical protein
VPSNPFSDETSSLDWDMFKKYFKDLPPQPKVEGKWVSYDIETPKKPKVEPVFICDDDGSEENLD